MSHALSTDARLLQALRAAEHPVAASELAAAAQLPVEQLAPRIDDLRAAGYVFELVPHLGYRLVASPDRLIADDLMSRLEGVALAREVIVFEETGSTNDVAARLARGGAAEGVVVFAERQTAGRGRLGRRWESAAHKGLWFSLLLRPLIDAAGWSRLTTWAALGVAQGLEAAASGIKADVKGGLKAGIKWPNDVYLHGRKAVGILIESAADPGGAYAIAGIGVNVNQTATDFPEGIVATSLREALAGEAGEAGTAEPLDRQAVAAAILTRLNALYPLLHHDFPTLIAEAESRSLLLGRWIEVASPHGALRGRVEGLAQDGCLVVRTEDGRKETLFGGEVSVLQW